MRNLRVTSHVQHALDLQGTSKAADKGVQISAVAIDALTSNIYAATVTLASSSASALAVLDLWQLTPHQLHLSSICTISRLETCRDMDGQIVSLDHLSDGGSFVNNDPALCLVCAGGDICLLALNDDTTETSPTVPEIVGSVEQGILAASWSPDEELLIIVTAPTLAELSEDGRAKGSTLLIMTRDFEVLSEEVLQTDDFGEERPITLGWGSKTTQFHGSEGKQAAEAAGLIIESSNGESSRGPLLEDDDLLPRISWRGDSNIFAVSSAEPDGPKVESHGKSHHRVIRTFGKTGTLLATSDPSSTGVSHVLDFKPTGILMATTQKMEDRHELAFFERNGLPKGGFSLRNFNAKVKEVAWNCDGSLLAIWLEDKVQLWSTGNYHWYLKQEIYLDTPILTVRWHNEQPLTIYIATALSVFCRTFTLDTCVSGGKTPNDAACAVVVDGNRLLLTPFRIQIVPPPMCSLELDCGEGQIPVDLMWTDISTSADSSVSVLAILLQYGKVVCYRFDWGKLGGKATVGGLPLPTPELLCMFDFAIEARQVALVGIQNEEGLRLAIGVLALKGKELMKVVVGRINVEESSIVDVAMEHLSLGKAARRTLTVAPPSSSTTLLSRIYVHEDKQLRNIVHEESTLADFFPRVTMLRGIDGTLRVLGLTDNGRLYVNEKLLAKDATSFAMTDHNIIWTNAAHEARFLPIASLGGNVDDSSSSSEIVSLGRRLERGSRIVAAVPSSMSLVLQMPRGNLETVAPRPLVLEVIRRHIDEKRYGSAFRICRTHRLDMNLLVDYNRAGFLANISLFVKQVRDSEYFNLFLSSLRQDDVTKTLYKPLSVGLEDEQDTNSPPVNKVNIICDSIREELQARPDSEQFTNTILTTFVRKSPPDYESALLVLQKLKSQDASLADEACKYIIFLTNANKLFDAALGMYDFTLPLLVAHHSPRKDPREYLPFLRELRDVQPIEMQRFRIDETLGRWTKALSWIVKAGEDHFDKASRFIVEHDLYYEALQEYANSSKLKVIQELYGDWLQERNRFKEAGILFALCQHYRKAIEADVKAGAWREAFEIATCQGISKTDMIALAKRVVVSLGSYGRNTEAATVAIDYMRNIEEGVTYLCKDVNYSEARRVAALHDRMDLVETHILPSLLEVCESLLEEIRDVSEQGQKQFERLAELRKRKMEHPEDFHPEVDIGEEIDGEDGFSQAFTAFTRFTRYTAFTRGAPGSVMSGFTMNSKRTRKSRRKDAKKQTTGKKGTIYEEDYLFESIQRLLEGRLEKIQKDAGKILLQLARITTSTNTEKYRRRGKEVYSGLIALETTVNEQVEAVWKETKREEEDMEVQRLKAIEEATSLGVSWSQLQSNGLFAPQILRSKIRVASVDWQLELFEQL